MKLKIGTPVYLVNKNNMGELYVTSSDAFYYLGHKTVGSFYREPYHRILPSFVLDETTKYVIPCSVFDNIKNLNKIPAEYNLSNIEDADDLDTTPIEYYRDHRAEIEEFYYDYKNVNFLKK